MKPVDLNRLTFGSDDAEHEEKRGFLDRVFLKTSIFNRAKDSQREIVIGRKGSGKSAICLMLKKAFEKESIITVLVTPQSLSRIKLEQLKTSSLNQDETYLLGWKYILLVTIGTKILDIEKAYKNVLNSKETKKLLFEIRKFLAENGEIEKSLLEKVSKSTSILSKFSIKAFGVEGTAETRELIVQKDIATEIEKFQIIIEKILILINSRDNN